MRIFVQAINIPRAYGTKEQIQNLLRNVGRVSHVSFHDGADKFHYNSVIYLEINKNEFEPLTLTPYDGEKISVTPVPEKIVKTLVGDDYNGHINTPYMSKIGTHVWDN